MTAYYNEIDPFAAATLRELIAEDVIAPGEVDERDIREVTGSDLEGFTQVHLFAGFGVWSHALRQAGWPDDQPVWTASCPCPPFSTAGKKKACPACGGTNPVPHVGRTGYFVCCLCQQQWLADARHLWPESWRLIRDRRPVCVYGEQVAGVDGETWLTSVRASLEILGYEVWPAGLTACGFGAPHKRERLYFVAFANESRLASEQARSQPEGFSGSTESPCTTSGVADAERFARESRRAANESRECHAAQGTGPHAESGRCGPTGSTVGHAEQHRLKGSTAAHLQRERRGKQGREVGRTSSPCTESLGNAKCTTGTRFGEHGREGLSIEETDGLGQAGRDPQDFWHNAVWIPCRNPKDANAIDWRPVEPAPLGLAPGLGADLGRVLLPSGEEVFFPLIEKGKARVGRLRGYGNSLCAETAIGFIKATKDQIGENQP